MLTDMMSLLFEGRILSQPRDAALRWIKRLLQGCASASEERD
jgi:hypothetical protein